MIRDGRRAGRPKLQLHLVLLFYQRSPSCLISIWNLKSPRGHKSGPVKSLCDVRRRSILTHVAIAYLRLRRAHKEINKDRCGATR